MLIFWIMIAVVTSLVGLLVLGGARRGFEVRQDGQVNASDAAMHELASLDQLKSDGLLAEMQWAEARAEAGRRWLDRTVDARIPVIGVNDRRAVFLGIIAAVVATLGLYFVLGQPGFPDQPYGDRVEAWAQSTEPLEPPQVAAVLAREVSNSPNDLRMLTLLGAARFQANDPVGAASAFRQALAIDPGDARNWARLGESLVRSQEGEIGTDAEAAFRQALNRDPDQLGARYFLGEAALGRGDRVEVRTLWTPLIAALEPTDPRRLDLEQKLAASEAKGGAAR